MIMERLNPGSNVNYGNLLKAKKFSDHTTLNSPILPHIAHFLRKKSVHMSTFSHKQNESLLLIFAIVR